MLQKLIAAVATLLTSMAVLMLVCVSTSYGNADQELNGHVPTGRVETTTKTPTRRDQIVVPFLLPTKRATYQEVNENGTFYVGDLEWLIPGGTDDSLSTNYILKYRFRGTRFYTSLFRLTEEVPLYFDYIDFEQGEHVPNAGHGSETPADPTDINTEYILNESYGGEPGANLSQEGRSPYVFRFTYEFFEGRRKCVGIKEINKHGEFLQHEVICRIISITNPPRCRFAVSRIYSSQDEPIAYIIRRCTPRPEDLDAVWKRSPDFNCPMGFAGPDCSSRLQPIKSLRTKPGPSNGRD